MIRNDIRAQIEKKRKKIAKEKALSKVSNEPVEKAPKIEFKIESIPLAEPVSNLHPVPKQDFKTEVSVPVNSQTVRIMQGGGYSPAQYQGKPDTVQWFGAFEGVQIKLLVEIRDLLIQIRDGNKGDKKEEVTEPKYMNNVLSSRRNDWLQTRG